MSLNYAASLSPYANKGKCGLPERFDPIEEVKVKCKEFADLIRKSQRIVCLTGAGISTSCGIPDFRGPNGVWTLEKKGLTVKADKDNVSFENARPSFAHYSLVELHRRGKLDFLISQNIDGLHMKSGFPMSRLAELHGSMFVKKCNLCSTKYVTEKCATTIGKKPTGKKCTKKKVRGVCRGELVDTILDWDNELPLEEMHKSELNCRQADLCICLGTTLQIFPVGGYPLLTKKNNGKIVIVNLQETRIDPSADLIINNKLDMVFKLLFENLQISMDKDELNRIVVQAGSKNDEVKRHLNVAGIQFDSSYLIGDVKKEDKVIKTELMVEEASWQPHVILLVSGKRKSGKSFVVGKLFNYFKDKRARFSLNEIILAAPIKEIYAKAHGLDYERLLGTSDYKEKYRLDMIRWSDCKREEDPFFFCKIAAGKVSENMSLKRDGTLNIWIVTDLRLQVELDYFKQNYPGLLKHVRILAGDEVRQERGWVFTKGVDDWSSECDLDSINDWDFLIRNNNDKELSTNFESLVDYLQKLSEVIVY